MENGQGIIASNNFSHKPLLAPIKVFTCKYCGRKFLNSRALGGHQNAHKKERTIWMAGVSNQTSIGVEPHSLLRKPVQDVMSTRKDVQSFKRVGDPIWKKQMFKGAASQDLGWPGSFHACSSDSNGPDTEAIVASTSSVGGRINEASCELNMHGGLDLELRL